MSAATSPAPPEQIVRYLAVFRRAFEAIARYAEERDREGMLYGGYLADALHNVPIILRRYAPNGWWKPQEIETWLWRIFPAHLRELGAPLRVLEANAAIFASEGMEAALGLQADRSDLNLAPDADQTRLLHLLYQTCLEMRPLMNYGNRREFAVIPFLRSRRIPFRDLASVWTDTAEELAQWNGRAARALASVPLALVRWQDFDEERLRQDLRAGFLSADLSTEEADRCLNDLLGHTDWGGY